MHRRSRGHIDGVLFALVLLAIVIASVITVAGRFWWLPPLASEHGAATDRLFVVTLVITGIVFVLVQLTLAWLVFRYRGEKGRPALFYPENRKLEIAWTVVPAVIMTVLIWNGNLLWSRIHSVPPSDAFEVEVWGQQFKWAFRYPGKDGKFGRAEMKLISVDNPLGIDTKDPDSKDDIFFPAGEGELHIPVNKPVVVYLRSKDVIHSFYVPAFRVKQDAVPGMKTRVWFVPNRKGAFEIVCAELCGSGHFTMRGILIVEEEKAVQEWLGQQPTVTDLIP